MVAVTLSEVELAAELGVESARATRLLATATALVEKYAPAAPEAVQNEVELRTAGYLHLHPMNASRGRTIGPLSVQHAPSMVSALRHSGGMAILSPWKIRRGGAA